MHRPTDRRSRPGRAERAAAIGLALLAGVLVAALGGCRDSGGERPPVVVTADWLNRSLTVFSAERLADPAETVEDAIIGTVDLSGWEPGPIEVEIVPGGELAIVAIGPGFFQSGAAHTLIGAPAVPDGDALLLVDLDALAVRAELRTRDAPMGIAISPDGARAYTANYGTADRTGDSISIIDVDRWQVLDEITVGRRPEQIAIDPSGTLGIVNLASEDGVRIFALADPRASLSDLVATGDDPSDVSFLSDQTRAVVANTFGGGLVLLDTSHPTAPTVIDRAEVPAGLPYGATYVAPLDAILVATGVPATVVPVASDGDTLSPAATVALAGGPFPLVAAVDATASFAFVPHMAVGSDPQLSIIDLATGEVRGVRWLDDGGPAYVAAWP